MPLGVDLGYFKRGGRDIDGGHECCRKMNGQRKCNAAAAGADVGDRQRTKDERRRTKSIRLGLSSFVFRLSSPNVKRKIDQEFCLGAWHQHASIDKEIETVELFMADNIGDWLKRCTARDQRAKCFYVICRERLPAFCEEPCAIPRKNIRKQQLGVEARRFARSTQLISGPS